MTTSLKADEQPASIPGSSSKEHIIVAQGMRFEPTVVFVSSGDIITWTNMEGHDTESIDNMIPAGAVKWRSILGQKISVNLKREGAYIYKCNPPSCIWYAWCDHSRGIASYEPQGYRSGSGQHTGFRSHGGEHNSKNEKGHRNPMGYIVHLSLFK